LEKTLRPRVKVCCISSLDEARLAVSMGADAVGLVSAMPSGPGVIEDATIAEVARAVPPPVARFLLTSRQDVRAIAEQARRTGVDTIQICDRLMDGSYEDLREAVPALRIVQVVHVTGPEAVDEAVLVAPHVDAVLLDSGDQRLDVKQLGGTGRRHDWTLSARIREAIDAPLFLAGGLNAWNAPRAIQEIGPFGLDICSGVRTDGALDEMKLASFMAAVERAS
jgi:phosphoribosylanthranilate isomerase